MGGRGYRKSTAVPSLQYSVFILGCPLLASISEKDPTKSPVLLISNSYNVCIYLIFNANTLEPVPVGGTF